MHEKYLKREEIRLKSIYEQPILVVEYFDEADVITASETEIDQADGKGYIPGTWYV